MSASKKMAHYSISEIDGEPGPAEFTFLGNNRLVSELPPGCVYDESCKRLYKEIAKQNPYDDERETALVDASLIGYHEHETAPIPESEPFGERQMQLNGYKVANKQGLAMFANVSCTTAREHQKNTEPGRTLFGQTQDSGDTAKVAANIEANGYLEGPYSKCCEHEIDAKLELGPDCKSKATPGINRGTSTSQITEITGKPQMKLDESDTICNPKPKPVGENQLRPYNHNATTNPLSVDVASQSYWKPYQHDNTDQEVLRETPTEYYDHNFTITPRPNGFASCVNPYGHTITNSQEAVRHISGCYEQPHMQNPITKPEIGVGGQSHVNTNGHNITNNPPTMCAFFNEDETDITDPELDSSNIYSRESHVTSIEQDSTSKLPTVPTYRNQIESATTSRLESKFQFADTKSM